MQHGFIKVCAATPEIKVADVDFNVKNIIKAVKESAEKGSQLTVFPELCICGYTCGDLFNHPTLIKACEEGVKKTAEVTKGLKALVLIGAPVAVDGRLYNCAVALSDGKILGIIPKTYLPNYGEFYEKRHFSPAPIKGYKEVSYGGEKSVTFGKNIILQAENDVKFTVGVEICEDLWAPESPSVNLVKNGADIIVNLSCSDETVGKSEYRRNLVKMQSAKLVCGYVYCDAGDGESTTDAVFSGHSIICEMGSILAESKLFENGLLFSEIDVDKIQTERRRVAGSFYNEAQDAISDKTDYIFKKFCADGNDFTLTRKISRTPFVPESGIAERSELILTIQQKGLEKRFKHTGSETALIGISGGLDSALALLVTCRAFKSLGKDTKKIIAVTMPCFGTTKKTKKQFAEINSCFGRDGESYSAVGYGYQTLQGYFSRPRKQKYNV